MPALTVVGGPNSPGPEAVKSAHDRCLYDDRYEYTALLEEPQFVTARYPSYPFSELEVDATERIFLEGVVYNRDDDRLRREVERYLVAEIETSELTTWLADLDGEFVFYVVDTDRGKVTAIPDLLGQLPLFYIESAGWGVFGRHKSALARLAGCTAFDQLAVAQYLRLGYALTDRTLYEDISRVPDGSVVELDLETGSLRCRRHHQFDFEAESHADVPLETNARRLADLFTEACRQRGLTSPGKNVILLSGGLDSRAVMGGFERADVGYVTTTRDFEHDSRADIRIAAELAASVDAPWTRVDTPAPTGSDLAAHLDMTAGTDPFSIAHIQPFLRRVRGSYNDPWAYTGDGGDKLLPDLSPPVPIGSMDDLVSFVLESEGRFDAEVVEAITGVSADEIRASIRDRLESYPETTPRRTFLHYQLFERGFAWLFEATDTNRNHLWTTTPFYSLEFLEYAMGCPDEQKRGYQLYRLFLSNLSPPLAAVQNANVGVAPTSRSHRFRYAVHRQLQRFPWVLERLLPIVRQVLGTSRDAKPSQTSLACMEQQLGHLSENGHAASVIDPSEVDQAVLSDASSYSRSDLYLLFTLLAALEGISDKSSLTIYRNAGFS